MGTTSSASIRNCAIDGRSSTSRDDLSDRVSCCVSRVQDLVCDWGRARSRGLGCDHRDQRAFNSRML